jgi:hypothetical protein
VPARVAQQLGQTGNPTGDALYRHGRGGGARTSPYDSPKEDRACARAWELRRWR